MTDREKTIQHLEIVKEEIRTSKYDTWFSGTKKVRFMGYVDDALELLKEQEAVKPTYHGDDSYLCDNCGETVGWEELQCYGIGKIRYKYCPECGRKVKWDDTSV